MSQVYESRSQIIALIVLGLIILCRSQVIIAFVDKYNSSMFPSKFKKMENIEMNYGRTWLSEKRGILSYSHTRHFSKYKQIQSYISNWTLYNEGIKVLNQSYGTINGMPLLTNDSRVSVAEPVYSGSFSFKFSVKTVCII